MSGKYESLFYMNAYLNMLIFKDKIRNKRKLMTLLLEFCSIQILIISENTIFVCRQT